MQIDDFKLERYFAKHEFSAKYILCASDCESYSVGELISKADFKELSKMRLGYTESQGSPALRKEISKLFTKVGPEDMTVSGTEEGIFITMNAMLDAGDRVVVQYPCYQSLSEIPKSIGCNVVKWEPEVGDGMWKWRVEALRSLVDKSTKMIIINSPHNPTGNVFAKKELAEIMNLAKENGCMVFSDEMYRFLEYRKSDMLPSGSDLYENCISLFGMSKTFGLGGLRLGWLAARNPDIIRKIVAFKDYTTICNNAFSEFVSLRVLRSRKKIIERNLGIIKSNLKELDRFFGEHEDKFTWFRPQAGPVSLVRINFGIDSEDFCEDVVNKKNVMLMPSTNFNYGNRYFRLGFGRKNMPEALKVFGEYVKENL
jgi:aspartate/methionine/tyrosine aminotransferase